MCTTLAKDYCHSFVHKCFDQLTDKMSDSDESFDTHWYQAIQLWTIREKVKDSINCEELAAASAYVDPEQPHVPPYFPPGIT